MRQSRLPRRTTPTRRRAPDRAAPQAAESATPLPGAGASAAMLQAPELAHATARALQHSALRQMQQMQGNRAARRELATSRQAATTIARATPLPAVDRRRKLAPEARALVESYWKRRRSDPAWAGEFHKLVDSRFWKETGYKVGKPLNPRLAEDRPFCEVWLQTRDKLMAEFSGDPIKDALVLLRHSPSPTERNTAENFDSGKLKAIYLDACPVDPKSDELLDSAGLDKSQFITRQHPDTKEQFIVQKNAQGTLLGNSIIVSRAVSLQRMKTMLVHETNHALQPDAIKNAGAGSFERYKNEFQAYWVAEFAGEPDLDKRAAAIKAHVLGAYPLLKTAYDGDAAFKEKVDKHTRPDGNVLNSARWSAIEKAVAGPGVDEQAIFDNLKAMSAEERAAVAGDANFMALLKTNLSGEKLKEAEAILAG
jgi:hypothetical protein